MDELSKRARALSAAIEPVAGQVYFSPECHANYQALGFAGSPGEFGGVAGPDGPAYFTSRGSVMGQVPGEVVACAFGVFNPAAVVPAVDFGWSLTDAATICDARDRGAIDQLERILGEKPEGIDRANELAARAVDTLRPEGRPLYAGLASLDLPGSPVGDLWRRLDMLREFRGDAHVSAWTTAGIDATEINLLTEAYWGMPMRSYSRTRAWSDAEFDAAEERLVARGLLQDGAITDAGRDEREGVEVRTDAQCRPFVDALGDDADELVSILLPYGAAIRAAKGYLSAGPADLAG
ncbi:MAG TPA: hypothetical protein VEA78_01930 [Acidimicrobiales bacterium]|nr:hypothetical protein [Acidimicrobiales bacterium]